MATTGAGQESTRQAGAASRLLRAWSDGDPGALDKLTRKAQVAELRFFGGLSVAETAGVLKISAATVMRDWSTAKVWLYRELAGGRADGRRALETRR